MGKKIKLPLETGLAALCDHIKAVKQTAEQSGSAVSALAEATAASMEEIEGILREKQEAASAVAFTVPAAGWASMEIDENDELEDIHGYPYFYDLAVDGVTVKDRADVTIAPGSVETATVCGLCPTTETLEGKIRLRSVNRPSEDIVAEYWLYSGKE